MFPRSHVYSPLQNAALWIGAWLHGYESFDATDAALESLFGPTRVKGEDFSSAQVLAEFRRHFEAGTANGPRLLLFLAPYLEAILLPQGPGDYVRVRLIGSEWEFSPIHGAMPADVYLLPGDADLQLADATTSAAEIIDARPGTTEAHSPRLTVGTLSDFYEAPGLPQDVAPRAQKLIARADTVSAIIETVVDTLGEHSHDPELLGLLRHVRQARMSAVSYALAQWR